MSIAAAVSEMINSVGEEITLRRYATGTRDAETGNFTRTYTDYILTAGVRSYSPKEIKGEIRQGDRQIRIAAADLAFTPNQEDVLIVDGESLNIYAVNVRKAFSETCLFIISARGA